MGLSGLLIGSLATAAAAKSASPFRSLRTKDNLMLTMRDGVQLFTDVDKPLFPKAAKIPAIMERSPYGVDGIETVALVLAELLGYVSVRQDFRGTEQSNGNFTIWHDNTGVPINDAYDTAQWITQQTWSNGQVFTTGASADGIEQFTQLVQPNKAMRGQFTIFATAQAWETFYVGGAYRQALIDGWLHMTVPNAFDQCDALVRAEEQPGNPWWQAVNASLYYGNVTWPSLMWGGWYDIFQQGNIVAFKNYMTNSAPSARSQSRLVMDPLGHCQGGADYFPRNTILGRALLPVLMALDMMADDSVTNRTWPAPPEGVKNVTLYVMGSNENGSPGQYWTTLPDFPAPALTNYYLAPNGALTTTAPSASGLSSTYVYDPLNPVPTLGGNNLEIACGPKDQRSVESRQDVLVFTTPPLQTQVAVTGEVTVTLYVSTNVTDTDFVVKLIDVYPASSSNPSLAGSSTLVLDGIARMKWRLFPSTNEPQLLSGNPADVYQVNLTLWHTSYIFAPGHSIRVHVTSSNWPRFYPNPNTGVPMSKAANSPNITAQSTVHYDAAYPSHVTLPVVDAASQLPPFPVAEAVQSMAERHAQRINAEVEAAGTGSAMAKESKLTAEGLISFISERMQLFTQAAPFFRF